MKKNITRKIYILYLIIMSIITDIVLILASIYTYLHDTFKIVFTIGSIGILFDILFLIIALIKMNKKEIDETSDERERFIISKASSLTGIVAFSLTPLMILFILVIPKYILISSFLYILIIGGVFKSSMFIYYKKF